jgi:hypothetical protein
MNSEMNLSLQKAKKSQRGQPTLSRIFPSLAGRSGCFAQIAGGAGAPPCRTGCGMFPQGYEKMKANEGQNIGQ